MMKQWLLGLLSAACLLVTGCDTAADSQILTPDYDNPDITLEVEEPERTTAVTTTETTETADTAPWSESETTVTTDAAFPILETTDTPEAETTIPLDTTTVAEAVIDKDGVYTTKEDVALYIYTYGELPSNFITKKEAQELGWSGGSLEPYAPGKCIGGNRFGNYEGLLPEKNGRKYTECDIDTLGKSKRGAKRIVFSNDGLIYYTDNHYESFTLLYGEETS